MSHGRIACAVLSMLVGLGAGSGSAQVSLGEGTADMQGSQPASNWRRNVDSLSWQDATQRIDGQRQGRADGPGDVTSSSSGCLRHDGADERRRAGIARRMQHHKPQTERAHDCELEDVASEADPRSDEADGYSRTRRTPRNLPGPKAQAERGTQPRDEDASPASDADNEADTLERL